MNFKKICTFHLIRLWKVFVPHFAPRKLTISKNFGYHAPIEFPNHFPWYSHLLFGHFNLTARKYWLCTIKSCNTQPGNTVPFFHVMFKSFKQLCDYFKIGDIKAHKRWMTRVGASSTSTLLGSVFGTAIREEEMSEMFYFIGSAISSHPSVSKLILHLPSGFWNNENERYNLFTNQLPT